MVATPPTPDVREILDVLRLSRRELLQLAVTGSVALALAGCTGPAASQIANRPVRRDVSSLPATDPMITAYRDAITAMRALPSSDRRNWTKQAEIHQN